LRIRCSALLATAAVLALCLVTLSCRSAEQKSTSHLERGKQYEQAGKHEEALLEYRTALQLQPSSVEANLRIARILADKGSLGDALFFYREAQRLDPTRSEAALAEARILLFEDTPRADELVRTTLEREPDNALAHLRAAEVALAKDDTKTALASVLTAIELDPKEGLYPYNLGVVRLACIREMRLKHEQPPDSLFEAALEAFRKSDQLYGGKLNSRLMLARTYASWPGHEKETEAALRDSLAFAKEKGSTKDRQAAAQAVLDYAGISQRADLRAWGLEEMVDADPSALAAWAEIAANADAQGKSGEEVYQRLLAARPSDTDAYVRYASYLASKNRGDDAIQALDGAVAKGGDPAAALDARTRLLLQLKRPDEARATVDRLRKEFASSPRAALAAARISLYEQRPAAAITELNRVTSSIEDAEAQFLLSQAQAALGNLEPAMAAIDRALALSSQLSIPILSQKATLHAAARDWSAVLQTLHRIEVGMGILPVGLRKLLAQALYGTKNDEAGRRVLERMLQDPSTLPAAAVLFSEHEGARNPQAAYKYLEAALAAAPDQPPLIAALVRLDMASGKLDRAVERLDVVLARGEEIPALRFLRAQVLVLKGDLAGAEADARKTLDADANLPGAVSLLVALYASRGELDKATQSLEAMDQAGSLHGQGRELLGRLYLTRGDSARARVQFEMALADSPNLADAKNSLAFVLASERADLDRALTLAQEAQIKLPNVPEVADTLGFVYLQKGLNEAAIDRFRYAIELTPPGSQPSPSTQYHLGLALAAAGRSQEAVEAFEKALATGTTFPEADAARSELERARAAGSSAPPAGRS